MADNNKSSFVGSCHCGAIKYEITIPTPTPSNPLSVNRCNCTLCQKLGVTNLHMTDPDTNFRLVSPDDKSQMGNYKVNRKTVDKYFCRDCAVYVYSEGYLELAGTRHDFFALNVQSLDQPQDGLDLSKVKIKYYDFLRDNFAAGAKDEPWPHGLP